MTWLKSRLPSRNYYICAYGEVKKEEGSRKIKVMQKGYLREMDYWRKSPGNYLYLDGEKIGFKEVSQLSHQNFDLTTMKATMKELFQFIHISGGRTSAGKAPIFEIFPSLIVLAHFRKEQLQSLKCTKLSPAL